LLNLIAQSCSLELACFLLSRLLFLFLAAPLPACVVSPLFFSFSSAFSQLFVKLALPAAACLFCLDFRVYSLFFFILLLSSQLCVSSRFVREQIQKTESLLLSTDSSGLQNKNLKEFVREALDAFHTLVTASRLHRSSTSLFVSPHSFSPLRNHEQRLQDRRDRVANSSGGIRHLFHAVSL
jgi:hypothetical protein